MRKAAQLQIDICNLRLVLIWDSYLKPLLDFSVHSILIHIVDYSWQEGIWASCYI